MKIIKFFFERPILVLLASFLLALFSIFYGTHIAFVMICALFLTTLIFSIIQKKWLKLFLSIIGFFILFLGWITLEVLRIEEELKPQLGNREFYTNEIAESSNLKIPSELKVISKIDTIVYIGFEGEYKAECSFKGSKKIIALLEKNISSNKSFKKAGFYSRDSGSTYIKEEEGGCLIQISFNKSQTQLDYSAWYY